MDEPKGLRTYVARQSDRHCYTSVLPSGSGGKLSAVPTNRKNKASKERLMVAAVRGYVLGERAADVESTAPSSQQADRSFAFSDPSHVTILFGQSSFCGGDPSLHDTLPS
jgi:hypothetical protein